MALRFKIWLNLVLLLAAAVLLAALLGCCSKLLAAAAEQKIPHQPNTVDGSNDKAQGASAIVREGEGGLLAGLGDRGGAWFAAGVGSAYWLGHW